jgi:hypothetical protein
MRAVLSVIMLGVLAACAPAIPDSGAGVGFDNSAQAQQARDAQLSGSTIAGAPLVTPNVISPESSAQGTQQGAQQAAQPGAPLALPDAAQPLPGSVASANSADIAAETAAALLAANSPSPTVLPSGAGGAQPNIASYARQSSNPVGNRIYSRTGMDLQAQSARNCRKYPSPDLAQSDFLAQGGPQNDRLALDPDGDGYACSWDPAPFRQAGLN